MYILTVLYFLYEGCSVSSMLEYESDRSVHSVKCFCLHPSSYTSYVVQLCSEIIFKVGVLIAQFSFTGNAAEN
jgi:hypothetical protein